MTWRDSQSQLVALQFQRVPVVDPATTAPFTPRPVQPMRVPVVDLEQAHEETKLDKIYTMMKNQAAQQLAALQVTKSSAAKTQEMVQSAIADMNTKVEELTNKVEGTIDDMSRLTAQQEVNTEEIGTLKERMDNMEHFGSQRRKARRNPTGCKGKYR